ncbi:DUF4873 domain-containing protein [Nocardia macrotermitis]|uniref:DUF4873 domain-containing protein n=1 Tax=Nocardia macrotermitis TaxID=2585198 RepID=A0A7K0DA14_9NOCA|nr:DUF4873 domain-containing protein [Nocardia macrotermitis]MQY22613.1 hypothetical protein [Nocardia macrotermitis]
MSETDDGYDGPALLEVAGLTFSVTVHLGGVFQPLDGRYRWYGRVEAHPGLTELVGERALPVEVWTAAGTANGTIAECDLWQRYRVQGTGLPPFRVPFALTDLPAG